MNNESLHQNQQDIAAVRRALDTWYKGMEQRDLKTIMSSVSPEFSSGGWTYDRLVELYTRIFALPEYDWPLHPRFDVEITIDGDMAYAEPIVVLRKNATQHERYIFRREETGWLLFDAEHTGGGPVEFGLPGLGPDYFEQLEAWTTRHNEWVYGTLCANPPNGGDRMMRRHAISMLDETLHLRSAAVLKSTGWFLRTSVDRALEEMQSETIERGVTVWKLYNHGWVVKSPAGCWGFDIYPGGHGFAMTDEQVDAIVAQIDVLSCSHWHGDHISVPVLKKAVERGIPVLLPPLPMDRWGENPQGDAEWVIENCREGALTLPERDASGEAAGIPYTVLPGHQDADLPNNVHVVSFGDVTVMQTGDQSFPDDFSWIDTVAEYHDVNVMMPNVWTTDMERVVRGVRPDVVIPGHENELGHGFEHREPFDQAYEKMEKLECDWRVMAWGERFHWEPPES